MIVSVVLKMIKEFFFNLCCYFFCNLNHVAVRVLKDDNSETGHEELGRIVIKMPMAPGTISGLWENDELFKKIYFEKYPGFYDTADVGYKCSGNYLTVSSRADDVINVAGHRISSSSIEEVCLRLLTKKIYDSYW